MNVKKDAVIALTKMLEQKQSSLRGEINRNRYAMADLVKKQSILKRELALLQPIINSLKVTK